MPSQVMRTIVKQIIKLHEALCSILPVNQVEVYIVASDGFVMWKECDKF